MATTVERKSGRIICKGSATSPSAANSADGGTVAVLWDVDFTRTRSLRFVHKGAGPTGGNLTVALQTRLHDSDQWVEMYRNSWTAGAAACVRGIIIDGALATTGASSNCDGGVSAAEGVSTGVKVLASGSGSLYGIPSGPVRVVFSALAPTTAGAAFDFWLIADLL